MLADRCSACRVPLFARTTLLGVDNWCLIFELGAPRR